MKEKRLFVNVFIIALVFALVGGMQLGFAQGPLEMGGDPVNPEVEASTAGYIVSPTISYQGKLIEGGVPFDGTASMTFGLWTMQTGGSLVWSEGPKSVPVDGGLFNVVLGDTTALDVNDFSQELWLEIDVKGTTLPRQKLMGAPYAFSLAPGAEVRGAIAGHEVLTVANMGDGPALYGGSLTSTGVKGQSLGGGDGVMGDSSSGHGVGGTSNSEHGVYAESNGTGLGGAALYAKSTNENGIALWVHNDSYNSADAALVISNDDGDSIEGDLIKGFGGDGGEDEFTIRNDGTIMTKADSSIFIPGTALVPMEYDKPRLEKLKTGGVLVYGGGDTIEDAYIPISIPAKLYGQNVKLKSVTIYYHCENGSHNYIRGVGLYSPSYVTPFYKTFYEDSIVRNSETGSSITFLVNHNLAAPISTPDDILNLAIGFNFTNTVQWVQIDGVRLNLGHHDLY
jgi:hypothetical protein